jgi:dienelactone hydrolase
MLGQVPKDTPTVAAYGQYSALRLEALSAKGNWFSYKLQYQGDKDTLFAKQQAAAKAYAFPKAYKGAFLEESYFICLHRQKGLEAVNLRSGVREIISGASDYFLVPGGSYVVIVLNTEDGKTLLIKNLATGNSRAIAHVSSYAFNSGTAILAIATSTKQQSRLILVAPNNGAEREVTTSTVENAFCSPTWNTQGNALACFAVDSICRGTPGLLYCKVTSASALRVSTRTTGLCEFGTVETSVPVTVSNTGARVFFGISQNGQTQQGPSAVQVWDTFSKSAYPDAPGSSGGTHTIAMWDVKSGAVTALTDTTLPQLMLAGREGYAVSFDPSAYEPQPDYNSPADYYVTDVTTAERKLLLKNFKGSNTSLMASPCGDYLTYFLNGHWYSYNLRSGMHHNLTAGLPVPFGQKAYGVLPELQPFGNPGWEGGGECIFLYDQYDIWLVQADGSGAFRMTSGAESKIVYRIAESQEKESARSSYNGIQNCAFEASNGLIIEAKAIDGTATGYYFYHKKQLKKICYGEKLYSGIKKAQANNTLLYLEQDFITPPALILQRFPAGLPLHVFNSNPQHKQHLWGKTKRLTYTGPGGRELGAVLCYPAGFNPEKKYPMIVHIYEGQSYALHRFSLPSLDNANGFNLAHLALQGYLILLPDIVYEMGNPGESALNCVTAAVGAVVDKGIVLHGKIGLIGHSFGGYETNYIISHTDIFAAAIAGSAVNDLISNYLYPGWHFGKPHYWVHEHGQLRMGASLFEDLKGYLANSSVLSAANVNTPLLSWSGAEDDHVPANQSLEMYFALRRLQKRHVLLVYPGEEHVLANHAHQTDLTQKIDQWFGHYLKGLELPAWMVR